MPQGQFFMLLRKLPQPCLRNWSTKKSISGCLPTGLLHFPSILSGGKKWLPADFASSVTRGIEWSITLINDAVTKQFLHLGLLKMEGLLRDVWFALGFATGSTPKSSQKSITEPMCCLRPVCSMRQIFDYLRKASLFSQTSFRLD